VTQQAAKTQRRQANLDDLLPSFRALVDTLLERMRSFGHAPVVHETYRTPERAALLSRKGSGSKNSLHCYGAAVDIICDRHTWFCVTSGCRFFDDLGIQAEALGLHWGGRFVSRVDKPHVQAIAVKDQDAFRRLTPEQRDAFVRTRLRGPVKA
jgi:hypothetical protein